MLSFVGPAGLETLLIREDVSGVHVISRGCAETQNTQPVRRDAWILFKYKPEKKPALIGRTLLLLLLDWSTFTFMHLADAFIQSDLQCI